MRNKPGICPLVRAFAVLLWLLMLPVSAFCTGTEAEVVDVDISVDSVSRSYALPIDFSSGSVPKSRGFSESKGENGKTVKIYDDSTIHAEISEGSWKGPEGNWSGTDVWLADIVISDPSQLRTASMGNEPDFSNKKARGKAVTLAKHMNAVVALNGDSWGADEKSGYGVVFRQGQLIAAKLDDSGRHRMDLLLIDENGDFHGIHAAQQGDLDDPSVYEGKRILNVFSFGPILVENGELVTDYQGTDRDKGGTWMNMRTDLASQRVALCQAGPLHYKIITCAGHRSGNRGLTLPEFAEFVASQDVQFAYNLDGGESSVLYFWEYGKVNMKNTDVRNLWDIIYFASAEQ